jgi:hypothetical protein
MPYNDAGNVANAILSNYYCFAILYFELSKIIQNPKSVVNHIGCVSLTPMIYQYDKFWDLSFTIINLHKSIKCRNITTLLE